MSHSDRIVMLGGHGKIALLATGKLSKAGYKVDSVIRNGDQRNQVASAGGNPVVLDMEDASVEDLAARFSGAAAVIFSAGAGGGNPDRTRAVDYEAATRAMTAAEQAGVRRFVMVSYCRAATDVGVLDPDTAFYVYARAKHDADAHLRKTELNYSILGPGRLTLEPGTGAIQLADDRGEVAGGWPAERKVTSRENVAEVMVHVVRTGAASRQTVNFYDGNTPIAEAVQ